MDVETATAFGPYVPHLAAQWWASGPERRHRVIDGSLAGIDISGFTALSERLAVRGKLGAEELILAISRCYEGLIDVAALRGGDVLKFRGDALLVFFDGDDHEARAAAATLEMQQLIATAGRSTSSVGPVELRMAAGIRSGPCHFFLVGSGHRELIVTGPAASDTLRLEDLAEAGEVLVSARTAQALPAGSVAAERNGAFLLRHDLALDPAAVDDRQGDFVAGPELVPEPLRAVLAEEAVEAEHRQAAVAFVKFTGTDALVADLEHAKRLLAELGDVVGDTVAELGVTWLESDIDLDGGKIYLVSGAPVSAGRDEERLLRAVRTIVDAGVGPPISAGVNRGPVFAGAIGSPLRRTYAVMGDTVNTAARLAARGKPGQVLASADVLKRSRARFEAKPQPFLVKGKERPINAFWLGALLETHVDEAAPLTLVGRDDELAMLREAIEDARRRTSRLVELIGEPGIGKSRLVEELRTTAMGFQQLSARCEEYESSTPFFVFRSLLRPLAGITQEMSGHEAGDLLVPWVQDVMPDLAPWLPLLAIPFDAEVPSTEESDEVDPSLRQHRLHEVLERFLERMLMMPTLLVFEDAHWMDDASEFFLKHLTRREAPRPWLVCVTRRPGREGLVRDGNGMSIRLKPLDDHAAATLALAAAGDAPLPHDVLAELTARAGGNPLFVRELVAAGADSVLNELPETIEKVITARIDTLDPVDRLLLRCASVIGSSCDLELLTDVVAREIGEAAELERWRRLDEFIAWEDTTRLRFRHDLFRDVSYGGLSFARRRQLHRLVGEALEERAGEAGEEVAELLSRHFLEAGEHDKAWGYGVVAGDRARAKYANVDAAEFYERALTASAFLTPDPLEVARIHEELGDVCELAARYERAQLAYADARLLVEDDFVGSTRLRRKEGMLLERLGRYDDALTWFSGALAQIEGAELGREGEAQRAELEVEYATILYRRGRFQESFRWSEQAVDHSRGSGDRSALAHAYRLLDLADRALGGHDTSYLELALPIYEEIGDLVGKAIVLNNLGVRAHFAGRWDEAVAYYDASGQAQRTAGDVVRGASGLNNEAEILLDQGHLDRAREMFDEALRVYRASAYTFGAGVVMTNLARLAARESGFEEAHRLFDEAFTELESIGADSFILDANARRAECLVFEGRYAEALELATRALERARELDEHATRAPLLERLIGYALAQARRPDEARPHFDESLRAAERASAEYELALTMRALADTGASEYRGLAEVVFDRLGVISTPYVPLP
jgi:class 3 adenylate cyclase/tetratricopeptide (TPR) repeat protein